LPVCRTIKNVERVCYECPKIHRWKDLGEHWPSLPWETLESPYKVYVSITFELARSDT